jgi:hypothetical protein
VHISSSSLPIDNTISTLTYVVDTEMTDGGIKAVEAVEAGLAAEPVQNAAFETLTPTTSRTNLEEGPTLTANTEVDKLSNADSRDPEKGERAETPKQPVGNEATLLTGLRLYLVFLALMMGVFMFALDQSVSAASLLKAHDGYESRAVSIPNFSLTFIAVSDRRRSKRCGIGSAGSDAAKSVVDRLLTSRSLLLLSPSLPLSSTLSPKLAGPSLLISVRPNPPRSDPLKRSRQ